MSRLLSITPSAWVECVLASFDAFLADHANCERKASAMALSFVSRYPDHPHVVDAMIVLAQEELAHFHAVYRLLAARQLTLVPDYKDPYVNALLRLTRHGRDTHLLDQLLIAGVVEARGCERFGQVANALPEGELKTFYVDITRSEARHGGLFVRLAKMQFAHDAVETRLDALFAAEADIVSALPLRPALH